MSTGSIARSSEVIVEEHAFRDVIGRFTSGVTVITTTVGGTRFGATANAVSSLSLDPPMILVCLNRSSDTGSAIRIAGSFCVNILAEEQQDLARLFASKGDKFANLDCTEGLNGVPVLHDTLAHLECVVSETVHGGTHVVFLARVAAVAGHDGSPLTYYRGRFGRLDMTREGEAHQPRTCDHCLRGDPASPYEPEPVAALPRPNFPRQGSR